MKRKDGESQPGIKWGPFTLRIPFVHTGFEGPEFLQGILVAAATGLALVPIMMGAMGLTFEEAVLMSMISSFLISTGPILFGEPFAAGWITPALPLVLSYVLTEQYPTSVERFQVMAALSLDLSIILLVLGITGFGKIIIEKIPLAMKGAIIMGAAIAALKRVFLDDAANNLDKMPWSMWIAMGTCLLLAFSIPIQKRKAEWPWLAKIASLGLLPGFLLAAIVGYMNGELSWVDEAGQSLIQSGIMVPPVESLFNKVSPFSIGFPPLSLMLDPDVLGLAFVAYIILFGDIITGIEVLRGAIKKRPDEKLDFDSTRTHLSTGIRNGLMALFAPMFPTQGSLWTGVHVIIVNRWSEGREKMDSLHSGIASYYFFGVPILFLFLPISTGLRPLLPIALALTLVLTGFACAYVAMDIPRNQAERGTVLFGGMALAIFPPFYGIVVAIAAAVLLLGFNDHDPDSLIEQTED
ncbi:MAG: hypothetical protein COA73_01375 [Candidatus Hydrogenedentota bacterium]|nr:MAG: hypothetical protein COA73_01375 [Candidatus Hydrogenedentota bacterium]